MVYFTIQTFTDGGDGHSDWEVASFHFDRPATTWGHIASNVDLKQPFNIMYLVDNRGDSKIVKDSFEITHKVDELSTLEAGKTKLEELNPLAAPSQHPRSSLAAL